MAELQQKVGQRIKFPPGYSITYGGQFQNLVDAKKRLTIAVPIALGLIFALLFFTFGSVRQSLLISWPFDGGYRGRVCLAAPGNAVQISAGVGFIALFGVAVLNGIVLIAEFNRLRHEEGLTDLTEIIRQGAEVRLRPGYHDGPGSLVWFYSNGYLQLSRAEVQKPLATVVIGGLLTLPCLR